MLGTYWIQLTFIFDKSFSHKICWQRVVIFRNANIKKFKNIYIIYSQNSLSNFMVILIYIPIINMNLYLHHPFLWMLNKICSPKKLNFTKQDTARNKMEVITRECGLPIDRLGILLINFNTRRHLISIFKKFRRNHTAASRTNMVVDE